MQLPNSKQDNVSNRIAEEPIQQVASTTADVNFLRRTDRLHWFQPFLKGDEYPLKI